MKRCPQCHRVETDESLKFCRVDGATLISDSSPISSEAGTAHLTSHQDASELHTSILPHHTNANVNRATGPTTALPEESHSISTKRYKHLRPSILIAIVAADDLSISVDLIDVKNKKTLWGERFERKMSDLLITQKDIATAIADKLQLQLSGSDSKGMTKQYTTDNEAYQLYLQGRYFWSKRSSGNLKKATELLKAATEKDPNFALAYAGLADCYAISYYYVGERPRDLMPLAKTYAAKASQLDPTLAEPHATLGFAAWLLDWDKVTSRKGVSPGHRTEPELPHGPPLVFTLSASRRTVG